MRALVLVLALIAGSALLGGCGLKGPLYLPQQKKTTVPTPPATSPPAANQSPSGASPGTPPATPPNNPGAQPR